MPLINAERETPTPNGEEMNSLLEYTHFYKGEEEPDEVFDSIEMARLYWDYERVWVKWELHPDENYKEDLRYFHRVFNGERIHHDVPVGLQAIFANRIEHWGNSQVTMNSLNRFIDEYLKAAKENKKIKR